LTLQFFGDIQLNSHKRRLGGLKLNKTKWQRRIECKAENCAELVGRWSPVSIRFNIIISSGGGGRSASAQSERAKSRITGLKCRILHRRNFHLNFNLLVPNPVGTETKLPLCSRYPCLLSALKLRHWHKSPVTRIYICDARGLIQFSCSTLPAELLFCRYEFQTPRSLSNAKG